MMNQVDLLFPRQLARQSDSAFHHLKSAMKKYEILSIEPSDLAHYWVISYRFIDGEIQKEVIEAIDSYEAFIRFRNQMIRQSKLDAKSNRI